MAEKLKGGQSPTGEQDRLFVNAYGVQGVGKTTFALTFPAPFFVVNCDRSMKHLLEALPSDYDVTYERIVPDVDSLSGALANQYLAKFGAVLDEAIKAGQGTFIGDGMDIFWDIVKIALLPQRSGGDDPMPREFAVANNHMNSIFRRLSFSSLHVCITAMAKKKWTGAKTETDMMESEGFKHRGRWLTHEVYMFTPEQKQLPYEVPVSGDVGQTHRAYVATSKINEALVGAVLPNLSFKFLYKLTFGKLPENHEALWQPGMAA